MPTENKPFHSWLIPITMNPRSTLALLDTGATCTMIGRSLYVQSLKLKTDEDLRLEVIGGGAAPTLGTATVQIGIAGGSYEQEVVVSANRENPNCILGFLLVKTSTRNKRLSQLPSFSALPQEFYYTVLIINFAHLITVLKV